MDCRHMGRLRGRNYGVVDRNTMQMTVLMVDENGYDVDLILPIRFEVCSTCKGRGTHINPSIDSNGITGDEWNEWDDDEREGYMGGRYDIACLECNGEKVIPVVAECRLSDYQKKMYEQYQKKIADDIAYERECAMERRMESGDW